MKEVLFAEYRRRTPQAWRVGLLAYVISRSPLLILGWLINLFHRPDLPLGHYLYHGGNPYGSWLVDTFQKWDSYWFLNIVRNGYQYFGIQEQLNNVISGAHETNITPFPLYPLLINILSPLLGDASLAGLFLSQFCFIGCLVLLYYLAKKDMGEEGAKMSVWFLALIPWSYSFSAIYSESLFLITTLGAVLACRNRHYLPAGLMGVLASLTRLPGLLVLIPMVWEYLADRGFRLDRIDRQILSLAIVPLGTLGYFAYLWWLTGEPLAYFMAQSGWHKVFVGFWYHPLQWLLKGIDKPSQLLDIGTTLALVAVFILGYKRLPRSYWLYSGFYLWMLLSSSSLVGMPRYVSGMFPLYLILGKLSEERPYQGRIILILFVLAIPVVFWVWTAWIYAF